MAIVSVTGTQLSFKTSISSLLLSTSDSGRCNNGGGLVGSGVKAVASLLQCELSQHCLLHSVRLMLRRLAGSNGRISRQVALLHRLEEMHPPYDMLSTTRTIESRVRYLKFDVFSSTIKQHNQKGCIKGWKLCRYTTVICPTKEVHRYYRDLVQYTYGWRAIEKCLNYGNTSSGNGTKSIFKKAAQTRIPNTIRQTYHSTGLPFHFHLEAVHQIFIYLHCRPFTVPVLIMEIHFSAVSHIIFFPTSVITTGPLINFMTL